MSHKSTLGGVKVGSGLSVNDGVLSATVSFDDIYPVGSVYISVGSSLPASFSSHGTWTKIADGRSLWTTSTTSELGANISGSLPKPTITCNSDNSSHSHDIVGSKGGLGDTYRVIEVEEVDSVTKKTTNYGGAVDSGAHTHSVSVSSTGAYGDGDAVRPDSIGVSMWKRVS